MVVHSQAIQNLTPDNYALIEMEHERIKRFMNDLLNTCCNLKTDLNCSGCSREKWGSCSGLLPSFILDLNVLVSRHFAHEEAIMLSRPHVTDDYEYFRNHREAHLDVMHQLQVIVRECNSLRDQENTADSYRHLFNGILHLFEEHDRSFDDPFIQSTIT